MSLLAIGRRRGEVAPAPTWTYPQGVFTVSGGTVTNTSHADGDTAILSDVTTDQRTVTGTVKSWRTDASNYADAALVFRYSDPSNYFYVRHNSTRTNPGLEVHRVQAGVDTMLVARLWTAGTPSTATVRLDLWGVDITVWVNGTELVTVSDQMNATATAVGVRLFTSGAPGGWPTWDEPTIAAHAGWVFNWPRSEFNRQATNPIIGTGAAGTYDDTDANNPNVVWDAANSRWVLNYTSYDGNAELEQTYSFAYSTSLDGPWTKDPGNPLYVDTASGQWSMNGGIVWVPAPYNYWLAQYGAGGTGVEFWFATSPDLVTWTKLATTLTNADTTNAQSLADGFLRFREDGVLELWYSARGQWLPARATSTDGGVTWTDDPSNPQLSSKPAFIGNNFAEHAVLVPPGKEDVEALLFSDFKDVYGGGRSVCCALTLDGGLTWHWRVASPRGAQAWDAGNNFDSFPLYDAATGTFHLFYAGAVTAGDTLNIGIEIGHQSVAWDPSSLVVKSP